MGINKIDAVVMADDILNEIRSKVTPSQLDAVKVQLENKINELNAGLDYKEAVNTYADLATTYPTPDEGWTVAVKDIGITYKYVKGKWIDIGLTSTPLATPTNDGLISKEDKTKLNTIENNAQKNLTATQTLDLIKTVDGMNSGLDSDLLDGLEGN